ncbi:Uncharacterised protein [Mycobacteroides abscessus subsp. abscessus]|nr:Uncharacterised protein [Mycobacteroides abscessus subsp. abscessus]
MKRPVATSRISASSSQLSHSRRTSSSVSAMVTCHPARPPETISSVAIDLERWNGSLCVAGAVGMSPMWWVAGATRAAVSTASRRPPGVGANESSNVTKSSKPCSASWTCWVQYLPVKGLPACLSASGCQPCPSRAKPSSVVTVGATPMCAKVTAFTSP